MFTLKKRPPGLEFSACEACHKGTRRIDLVAALTARSWPNLDSDEEKAELQELMHGVLQNVPPVADELARVFNNPSPVPKDLQAAVGVGEEILVGDFSVRRSVLQAFGARVGLALHYEMRGVPLPEQGGVWATVFSNTRPLQGQGLSPGLDEALGPPLALMQKGLRAERDFQYAKRPLDDHAGTISFASFRHSFAILAIAYPDANDFPDDAKEDLFRPGFLIGFPL